jgi:hypothetical protein
MLQRAFTNQPMLVLPVCRQQWLLFELVKAGTAVTPWSRTSLEKQTVTIR